MIFTVEIIILGEKFRIKNVSATNEFEARKAINDFIQRLRSKNATIEIFGKELKGTPAELKSSYKILKVEEQKTETEDFTQTLKDFLGL